MNRMLMTLMAVLLSCTACAKEQAPATTPANQAKAAPAAQTNGDVETNIRAAIKKLAPGAEVDSIAESVLPGVYEVAFGAQVVYMSGSGRYLLQGSMFDVDKREDLTEKVRQRARKAELDKLKPNEFITFAPENPKHTVTVFTDIDCGYCRKLHAEMKGYNDLGIAVKYLFFPRSGPNTPSFSKAENVWCAKDSQAAMTDAKVHNKVSTAECDNPIAAHYALGNRLGVSGTPAMMTSNGTLIPGYQPPAKLLQTLEQAK